MPLTMIWSDSRFVLARVAEAQPRVVKPEPDSD